MYTLCSEALSDLLETPNCQLSSLNVEYNSISRFGATTIGEALSVNTSLTSLKAAWNGFGEGGCAAVATGLTVNSTLMEIDLSYNRMNDVGAALMAYGIRRNTGLMAFSANGNPVGVIGGRALTRSCDFPGHPRRRVSCLNCSYVPSGRMKFDPSNPNQNYRLDLSKHPDRAVASELLELSKSININQ